MVDIMLTVAQLAVFVYDVVSYPVYMVLQRPWQIDKEKKVKSLVGKAVIVTENDNEVSYRRDISNDNKHYREIIIDNKVRQVLSHMFPSGCPIICLVC